VPNLLAYPIAMLGAFRAGVIVVNVNPLYAARELEHQVNDAGAQAIVAWSDVVSTLEAVIARTSLRHVIVTETGDLLDRQPRPASPLEGSLNAVSFIEVLERGREARGRGSDKMDAPDAVEGSDIAFLQYTGGTTGVSKGAMLTHRNVVANVLQNYAALLPLAREAEPDIFITALPLYHIFGLTVHCLCAIYRGALNVLILNPRDIEGLISELRCWRFSHFAGVTTLYNALLNSPDFETLDFSGLRVSCAGGMAMTTATAKRWKEITGHVVLEGYGLSETSPTLTLNPPNIDEHTGTVGLPLPSTEISIRDDAGTEVGIGTPGEICARGPQVMRGYWRREDATRAVMTDDGFFRTGDIGVMDERGFVRVVDRKKDMICVSGFNVFPNEVEDIAASIDGVLECACIGVPDAKTGEAVTLCLVPKQGHTVTLEDVRTACRREIASYKVPTRVEFLDELPKSNVGKILRRELRNRFAADA